MKSYFKILTLTAVLVVASGCAKEPAEEIQAVNQAIAEARTEMVQTYAPESLERAEQAAAAFEQELAAQRDKWAVSRDYDQTMKLAEEAKSASKAATEEAVQNKETVHQEVLARLEEARAEIETAEHELGTAPVGKGNKAEIQAMKQELEAARTKVGEIESELAAERYMEARIMADDVIETATRITEAVRTAREMKAAGGRRT